MNAEDITEMVKHKEDEFEPRNTRMDKSFDRWDLVQTTDPNKGYDKHKEAINITSNDPRTFADKLQRGLVKAERRLIVRMAEEEGEDKREDIGKLERLLAFLLEKADERLWRLLMPPMLDSLVWFGMIRGWLAARILTYKTKEGVVPNYMALDPRWVTYEIGKDGTLWTAYKTFRSKDAVQDEYKHEISSPWYHFGSQKKDVTIIDWYNDEFNYVVIGNEIVKGRKHGMPSNPILIAPIATRPPVISADNANIRGFGDDIFASSKDIGDIENEMLSIWATQAKRIAREVMIHEKEEGVKDIHSITGVPGGVINVPMGKSKLYAIPSKEVSPTLVNLMSVLGAQRQRATLPRIDYGEYGTPPPSGTMASIAKQESTASQLVVNALNSFYSQMCNMIELQLIEGKLTTEVKGEQDKKYYSFKVKPTDLKKPHITRVEFSSRTPYEELETLQSAQMAQQLGLPMEWWLEHILKVQDPKGIKDMSLIEIAEHSPDLAKVGAINALIKAGRGEEAMLLMKEMYEEDMAKQAAMAQQQAPAGQQVPMEQQGGMPPEGMPPEMMGGRPEEEMMGLPM